MERYGTVGEDKRFLEVLEQAHGCGVYLVFAEQDEVRGRSQRDIGILARHALLPDCSFSLASVIHSRTR